MYRSRVTLITQIDAYHSITLDKYSPFHIYNVTPIHHPVDHHLLHENRSLLEMDSREKNEAPFSPLK